MAVDEEGAPRQVLIQRWSNDRRFQVGVRCLLNRVGWDAAGRDYATIAEAVLEVIQNEGLQKHARDVGNYLAGNLLALKREFPALADVRGSGLFLGVEICTEDGGPGTDLAKLIKNQLRRRHILVSTDGPYEQVLKIKPPLTFSKDDADQLCSAIKSILEADY